MQEVGSVLSVMKFGRVRGCKGKIEIISQDDGCVYGLFLQHHLIQDEWVLCGSYPRMPIAQSDLLYYSTMNESGLIEFITDMVMALTY